MYSDPQSSVLEEVSGDDLLTNVSCKFKHKDFKNNFTYFGLKGKDFKVQRDFQNPDLQLLWARKLLR